MDRELLKYVDEFFYWQGYSAYMEGKERSDNPYTFTSKIREQKEWDEGFCHARDYYFYRREAC